MAFRSYYRSIINLCSNRLGKISHADDQEFQSASWENKEKLPEKIRLALKTIRITIDTRLQKCRFRTVFNFSAVKRQENYKGFDQIRQTHDWQKLSGFSAKNRQRMTYRLFDADSEPIDYRIFSRQKQVRNKHPNSPGNSISHVSRTT